MNRSNKKKQNQIKIGRYFKKWYGLIALILIGCGVTLALLYILSDSFLRFYINNSAKHLIALDKKGLLSKEYGYVWSEIHLNRAMQQVKQRMTSKDSTEVPVFDVDTSKIKKSIPSIDAIAELNSFEELSRVISVTDRNNYPLAEIRTTQNSIELNQLNPFLLEVLLLTEDKNFYSRKRAYDSKALVRALFHAGWRSLKSLKVRMPRGTSTVHQQVARFLLLKFNSKGYTYIDKSFSRKVKELKLAQALMLRYSKEEILKVYINHCISAGKGMVGLHDISMGLFDCTPAQLDTSRCLYLSRLVKWNSHVPKKIIRQVKLTLPRLADHYNWSSEQTKKIGESLDTLSFQKQKQIVTDHSHLLDCANVNWLQVCKMNGMNQSELRSMNIANPHSMIRRKGHVTIQLHIDMRLQKLLEEEVEARGYGKDTTLVRDVRIGSYGHNITSAVAPQDTLRHFTVLAEDSLFKEPNSSFTTQLLSGDTLVTNIRYTKKTNNVYRRSLFFYKRDTTHIPGQYFSYAIINAKSGQLLAYYSKDKLGSNLNSLIRNSIPNGSVVAKPILFALNYDVGNFNSITMMTDKEEVSDSLAWTRSFAFDTLATDSIDTVGVVFHNTSQEEGYTVHNHHRIFDGYDYAYNHLARSNNIVTVEGIYRLNSRLYNKDGEVTEQGQPILTLLSRIGQHKSFHPDSGVHTITGPQIYAAIARAIGAQADSIMEGNKRVAMPPDNYSVALGTLELSLYEQIHLFNAFYNNQLVDNPRQHPSLVIKDVVIAGEQLQFIDSIPRYTLFADEESLFPVKLGMYKRLISDPADGLVKFEVPYNQVDEPAYKIMPKGLLSNYAKSGTTDDIIIPYNRESDSEERTNYGLWNATIRITLSQKDFLDLLTDTASSPTINPENYIAHLPTRETLDITVACIGECNFENTGMRDGKTLHKFITKRLLDEYGVAFENGFYRHYEQYIHAITPDSVRFRDLLENEVLSSKRLSKILSKTKKGGLRELDELHFVKKLFFGLRLEKKSYLKLLSYAPYLGSQAKEYVRLIEKLKKSKNISQAKKYLKDLSDMAIDKKRIKKDIDKSVEVLLKNLELHN